MLKRIFLKKVKGEVLLLFIKKGLLNRTLIGDCRLRELITKYMLLLLDERHDLGRRDGQRARMALNLLFGECLCPSPNSGGVLNISCSVKSY